MGDFLSGVAREITQVISGWTKCYPILSLAVEMRKRYTFFPMEERGSN